MGLVLTSGPNDMDFRHFRIALTKQRKGLGEVVVVLLGDADHAAGAGGGGGGGGRG